MKQLLKYLSIFLLTLMVWSFFIEPNLLVVKSYKLHNENLRGIKIVFASDFHLKKYEHQKLKKIVNKINSLNADIVLLGGDFVNGQTQESTISEQEIAGGIAKIKSPHGIYTVLGNHDWWYDGFAVKDALVQNGIKVLMNENLLIKINGRKVCIAGVEDLSTRKPDIEKTLAGSKSPVILLSHSPDIFPDVPDSINLTLAGHTHGGQVVLPFWGPIFVPSDFGDKYAQGFIQENKKQMIVSKGIGTSSIYVRFNCLPEIVVISFE